MKNKPKTIADLKFNWIFNLNFKTIEELKTQFEKLNPNILRYKIKSGDYKFIYSNDHIMWFHVTSSEPLSNLIDCLNYTLYLNLRQSENAKPLKLLKFELISETEFKLHVEESKE
jgi:hypothetical protein